MICTYNNVDYILVRWDFFDAKYGEKYFQNAKKFDCIIKECKLNARGLFKKSTISLSVYVPVSQAIEYTKSL